MLYIAHYSKVSPRKSFIGYRPDPVSQKILIPAFSASLQKGSSSPYLHLPIPHSDLYLVTLSSLQDGTGCRCSMLILMLVLLQTLQHKSCI